MDAAEKLFSASIENMLRTKIIADRRVERANNDEIRCSHDMLRMLDYIK